MKKCGQEIFEGISSTDTPLSGNSAKLRGDLDQDGLFK
jgi:hypothetical protein